MLLYGAVLAAIFGGGSSKPFRTAVCKIIVMILAASAIGLLIARATPAAPSTQSAWFSSCTVLFVVEIATLFGLVSTLGIVRGTLDHLSQLLLVLPLQNRQRYVATLLPCLVFSLVILALITPTVGKIALDQGTPPYTILLSGLVGVLAAYGLVFGITSRLWLLAITTPLVLLVQYKILATVNAAGTAHLNRIHASILLWISALLLAITLAQGKQLIYEFNRKSRIRQIVIYPLMYFGKKIVRSGTTRLSLATTVLISFVTAVILHKQHLDFPQIISVIVAFLAASFSSDARSLASRINPAEVTALRGTPAFVTNHFTATFIFASLALAPLLVFAHSPAVITSLFLGVSTGIFAGTITAPEQRDISGQCLTAILCVAILFLPTYMTMLHDQTIATYFGLSICLVALTYFVEYKRNKFTWRKHVPKSKT